jgi:hypothetical protein
MVSVLSWETARNTLEKLTLVAKLLFASTLAKTRMSNDSSRLQMRLIGEAALICHKAILINKGIGQVPVIEALSSRIRAIPIVALICQFAPKG